MKKVVLLILDGIGVNKNYDGNAFLKANKPNIDFLLKNYPKTYLGASETYVGLPKGQIGGSEVGHQTIGAGRIIDSDLLRINKDIKSKKFFKNKILLSKLKHVNKNSSVHLVGLLSDGGVHSHISHLFAFLDILKSKNFKNIYIHIFSDGRDVNSKSVLKYISLLKIYLHKVNLIDNTSIASISGRFFAMDRDNRWKRIKQVYDCLVLGNNFSQENVSSFVKNCYKKNITDEFIVPTLFDKNGIIKENDCVIFYNFRSDRAREFSKILTDNSFKEFKTKNFNLNFISLTTYDDSLKKVFPMYTPKFSEISLGEIISKNNLKQLRLAETEKYAHVTYFFNQGFEKPFKNEDRILVPSPKVSTYDLKPEMSVDKITNNLLKNLNKDYSLFVVNFANGDMVGHTGNILSTIKGIEKIDSCIGKIFSKINLEDTTLIITSDHGNCDEMVNENRTINTSHSLHKVFFILVSSKKYSLLKTKSLGLANIAPTILDLLDIKKPKYMFNSLIKK
ncbi:MAG: 2,3-bisphosphoglycerate-independent phosphoglycerate mutase [Candidatus ainarchaeum sp.]|nr:2,3-bisphosphoglycerate-independent phosphoglycerate mutase [Candidatus ainarchaeum sp.]MDD3976254.1 2,3-bisphosphoglycerate-independent phosphoglycerate mutase [Candidatus ainarchaeum sp.]